MIDFLKKMFDKGLGVAAAIIAVAVAVVLIMHSQETMQIIAKKTGVIETQQKQILDEVLTMKQQEIEGYRKREVSAPNEWGEEVPRTVIFETFILREEDSIPFLNPQTDYERATDELYIMYKAMESRYGKADKLNEVFKHWHELLAEIIQYTKSISYQDILEYRKNKKGKTTND